MKQTFSIAAVALLTSYAIEVDAADDGREGARKGDHPNIVFILADDLGYGDVAC